MGNLTIMEDGALKMIMYGAEMVTQWGSSVVLSCIVILFKRTRFSSEISFSAGEYTDVFAKAKT
jgi:hypothetical protein